MQPPANEDETLFLPTQSKHTAGPSTPRPPVKYRVIDEIARGGMGAVLRVHDPDLDRILALKVLLVEHLHHPEMHRRFLDEARITSRLQHPGVVPVHDIGTFADDRPFFTMKLVAGRTLAAVLRERTTPADDQRRFLAVFEQVCQTVAYVHAKGVIHRDLKPSNIMVGGFGEVQVMDWGVAKAMRPDDPDEQADEESIAPSRVNAVLDQTFAGSIVGTPAYMAPEQARGETMDERADVFGLGGILCEILTGSPPYTAVRCSATILLGQDRDLTETHDRLEGCGADRELIDLARACLAENPEERPADGQEVARRLAAYRAGVDERLHRAELERAAAEARAEVALARTKAERRARRLLVGFAAVWLLLFGVLVTVGWWYAERRRTAENRVEALASASRQAAQRAGSLEGEAALDRWREAAAQLDQAYEAAEGHFVAARTRERIEAERGAVRAEVARLEDERALFDRLHEARVIREDDLGRLEIEKVYSIAFAAHGLAFDGVPPAEFAARVRARSPAVAAEVVTALDDWAMTRLRAGRPEGQWKQPMQLAQEADADPWQRGVRQRILDTARPEPLTAVDLITPPVLRVGGLAVAVPLGRRRGELVELAEKADVVRLRPSGIQLLAGQLLREGLEANAERLLRRAVVARPNDLWLNYDLGRVLEGRQPAEALRYFSAARAARPEIGHEMAHVLESLGRSEDAVAVFTDLVRLLADTPSHHVCLGNALRRLGRHEEAVKRLEEAIRRAPQYHQGYVLLAQVLLDRGEQLPRAKELAQQAAQLNAGSVSVQVTLARALAATGDAASAEAAYRRALLLAPGDEEGLFHYAGMLAGLGRTAEAIAWYDRLVRLRPGHLAARGGRGTLLRSVGRLAEARADLEMVLASNSGTAAMRAELARVLMATDSFAAAVQLLQKAAQQDAASGEVILQLAECLFRIGRAEEAGQWLDRLKEFPADPGPLYNLGTECLNRGQFARSVRLLRASLKRDPSYPETHCNLGHALMRSGRYAEAAQAFERGHELGNRKAGWKYPSGSWLRQAREGAAVEPRLAGLADGSLAPANQAELELAARVCDNKGLHVTRMRVMERRALIGPLTLGDRISLAESRVRAGLGRCRDAVLLTGAQRAEARATALKALSAEVAGLGGAEGKRWAAAPLASAALAGVREEAELARLPPAEREEWRGLWRAVRAVNGEK